MGFMIAAIMTVIAYKVYRKHAYKAFGDKATHELLEKWLVHGEKVDMNAFIRQKKAEHRSFVDQTFVEDMMRAQRVFQEYIREQENLRFMEEMNRQMEENDRFTQEQLQQLQMDMDALDQQMQDTQIASQQIYDFQKQCDQNLQNSVDTMNNDFNMMNDFNNFSNFNQF